MSNGGVAWITNWLNAGDIYYAGKDEGKGRFYTAKWRSRRLLDTGRCGPEEGFGLQI